MHRDDLLCSAWAEEIQGHHQTPPPPHGPLPGPPIGPTPLPALDPSDPRGVQRILSKLGYYPGDYDGNLRSPESMVAITSFQADRGLTPDGIVGRRETIPELQRYVELLSCAPKELRQCRRFRLTTYYVAEELDYTGAKCIPVFDRNRNVLAEVTPSFFAKMSLEGTGKLADGRLLNVSGGWVPVEAESYAPVVAVAKRWGFLPNHAGYAGIAVKKSGDQIEVQRALSFVAVNELGNEGYGVCNDISMDFYRTLAADIGRYSSSDPRCRGQGGLVPLGTRVWIADVVGQELPDGTLHDGWFQVNDTGGAIFGAHFDIFAGVERLARKMSHPKVGHIWFEGIEKRIPCEYSYGVAG